MAASYRKITKVAFLVTNILTAVVFLLACLAPYLHPTKWSLISLFGLGFAFIIITLIAFVFFWLVFKVRYVFISLIPMLIGWKSISVFFAFHVPDKFDYDKAPGSIRVAHWNVARFTEWKRNNNKGSQTRLKMMDLIKEQNADVLCFQEFFTSTDPQYYNNLQHIRATLGYPYFYYSWDDDGSSQWVGQIIFSRYPIIDSGIIRYPAPSSNESLIHADLKVGDDTVRIYTTHLQSVQFKKRDYQTIEDIKNTKKDGVVENSKGIFKKLRRGVMLRAIQAEILKKQVSLSRHPFVLTGDFNDVPNSYSYFTIKGNDLQDAHLMKGFGVGKTFSDISPTLRIDYLLTTKNFAVRQFNRLLRNYSDHYMLVADVELKN